MQLCKEFDCIGFFGDGIGVGGAIAELVRCAIC